MTVQRVADVLLSLEAMPGSGAEGTAQANRAISRTATVTGATSATINFTLTDNGIDAGETMVAEYSIDGGGYVNIGTLDGGTGWSGQCSPFNHRLSRQ